MPSCSWSRLAATPRGRRSRPPTKLCMARSEHLLDSCYLARAHLSRLQFNCPTVTAEQICGPMAHCPALSHSNLTQTHSAVLALYLYFQISVILYYRGLECSKMQMILNRSEIGHPQCTSSKKSYKLQRNPNFPIFLLLKYDYLKSLIPSC